LLDARPIAALIGAEIRGLDLNAPLTGEEVVAVIEVLADRGVVVFPDQQLGPEALLAVARQFGEIKRPPDYFPETLSERGYPEISVISTENGLAYTSDAWHSDVTWMENPPKYSILHMQVIPPAGGDTQWASQFAAYDSLSEPMKGLLGSLTVRHALPGSPERFADHPVVCRHPISGRKALFVNGVFAARINELTEQESDAVLQMLCAHGVRPEFTCRWRWREGEVAIWDNHFVQHYALADYHPSPRRIHRIEIQGDAPLPASEGERAW
jgi:taurine dioxygenase